MGEVLCPFTLHLRKEATGRIVISFGTNLHRTSSAELSFGPLRSNIERRSFAVRSGVSKFVAGFVNLVSLSVPSGFA
jgi:hypothetical protein